MTLLSSIAFAWIVCGFALTVFDFIEHKDQILGEPHNWFVLALTFVTCIILSPIWFVYIKVHGRG
jgi:hypothetical protein